MERDVAVDELDVARLHPELEKKAGSAAISSITSTASSCAGVGRGAPGRKSRFRMSTREKRLAKCPPVTLNTGALDQEASSAAGSLIRAKGIGR